MSDVVTRENAILAWHFLRDDGTTRNGGLRPVAGETLHVDGPVEVCEWGLHASERLIDALPRAPGVMLQRVALWGDVEREDDKIVATDRTCLWMIDATTILHEWACRVAEDALKRADVTDKRSWNAIAVKRRWLAGNASDDELAAARAAAWAAARAAAWAAAWDAAWDAAWGAALDAAWAAMRDAAWDAARGAALDAAWGAALDAAWNAAWGAALDAAWARYNGWLTEMVEEAHGNA